MSRIPTNLRRGLVRWATPTCAVVALLTSASPAGAQASPFALKPSGFAAAAAAEPNPPSGFTDTKVWTGLTMPSNLRWAPDGRIFVAQLDGVIKVFSSLADPTPSVYADLSQ